MRRATIILTLSLVVFAAACGGGTKTTLDYDPSVDFSAFRTYSWMETDGHAADRLTHDRIVRAIDATLQTKGLELVESGGDFAVGYQATTQQRSSYTTVSSGWGTGWGRRGWRGSSVGVSTSTTRENVYDVGTLILGLFDGKTKDLAWTGTASDTISAGKSPQERQDQVTAAVEKMMRDFPPGS